ncbi:hypothetical protein Acr_29g0007230 [Actinidia rufa]|uniref:Reverse transcriptase Ty1/copia-type domain-containing protein n=1 Tax=Actinidia rufa TaxID=165716 RepID=A0A7J0HF43_9ERIC|nr:hypothetical protein Acr_29g0007230 [Actinidia rufa]
MLFLMGLSDIYEPIRASLLHRIPLPTLEQAISELLSEETHLGLVSTSHVATTLATPSSRGRGSSGGSHSFSASGGLASRPNECTFCHSTDHRLLTCPIRDPRTSQTLGIGCRHGRLFQLIHLHLPISTAVATSTSSSSPSFGIWHSRLALLGEAALTAAYTINRVPSPLLSNLTPYKRLYGTPPDYHSLRAFGCAYFVLLQPHERTKLEPRSRLCCFLGYGLSIKAIVVGILCLVVFEYLVTLSFGNIRCFFSLSSFQMSSSSTPPYLTDPSINLFPEDVNVLADPPDDTLHMAPPPIVYPVESSSTDPATPVLPPVALPSDIPTRRSTRLPLSSSSSSNQVCRLRCALYGLKQARACLSAHDTVLLLLYVDDIIITGDDVHGISELQDFLHRHFEMKDLGPLGYFLGLEVSSGITGYSLTQTKYASNLLTRASLSDCKTTSTPLEANARLTSLDGDLLSDATLYRQLIGNLIYLTVTCSDIAHAVHLVSQFMSAPCSTHYAAVLRILRYVKGTLFHGLHFSSQSSLQLYAYSDADWAKDPTARRSTTGFCFFLGDSLISWRSKKQTLVARSSTEVEYRGLVDTTQELFWLRWLLQDMGHVVCNTVHLLPVSSVDQTADIFSKSFLPGHFDALVTKLKLIGGLTGGASMVTIKMETCEGNNRGRPKNKTESYVSGPSFRKNNTEVVEDIDVVEDDNDLEEFLEEKTDSVENREETEASSRIMHEEDSLSMLDSRRKASEEEEIGGNNVGSYQPPHASIFVGSRQRSKETTLEKCEGGKKALDLIVATLKVQVSIHHHSSGWIIFEFYEEETKIKVMQGGPYMIFGRPLLLKTMHKSLAKICSIVGNPICVDKFTANQQRVSYARVLIKIDVAKNVAKSIEVVLPTGQSYHRAIYYENLPKFCSNCRVMGHSVKNYKVLESIEAKKAAEGQNSLNTGDRVDLEIKESNAQAKHCLATRKATSIKFYVTFIYAFNTVVGRRPLWENLCSFKSSIDLPWILLGLRYSGVFHTWSNNTVWSKLDRAMVNIRWVQEGFSAIANFGLPWKYSDHSPLSFVRSNDYRASPFNVFNMWVQHSEFLDVVDSVWRISDLKGKACRLAEADMSYCSQLAKVKYLKDCDKGIKFFHDLIKSNKARNQIVSLMDVDGVATTSPHQVSSLFVDYYKILLGTRRDYRRLDKEILAEGNLVKVEQTSDLVQLVLDEEIKGALFDIGDDKAPGPDGYTSYVFKKAWSIVGTSVCAAVKEFFRSGQILKQINHATIALAPKSLNASRVEEYRPISYYNVMYKIISKILAKRLAPLLEDLIDPAQSAFVLNLAW